MNDKFKIYTKTGDDGTSGLIGGTRVEKFDQRLEAYGTVDEVNSWVGLIKTETTETAVNSTLNFIQNKLFVIGSQLATDPEKATSIPMPSCTTSDIKVLELEIDRMNSTLPELKNFILPGGSKASSYSHLGRTTCRRAERRIAAVAKENNLDENILIFVNRLSDYFFILARYMNHILKFPETKWLT